MTLLHRKLVPTVQERSNEQCQNIPRDSKPTKFRVGTAIPSEIDNVRTNVVSHLAEVIATDFDNDPVFSRKELENTFRS